MKTKLHPGAKWIFRFRGYFSVIFIIIFLGVFGFSIGKSTTELLGVGSLFTYIIIFLFTIIFFTLIISEIYARMAYNRWFYEIGSDSIRLERGIITKRYSNIPYERVQNVDIRRGIIARIFGFSSLQIQTAGYSIPARGHGGHAEGHIPAVNPKHAEEIREFVLKNIKGRKQGL